MNICCLTFNGAPFSTSAISFVLQLYWSLKLILGKLERRKVDTSTVESLRPSFPLLCNLEAYCCSQYFATGICRNSYFRCEKALQVVRACRYLSQSKQSPACAMLESAGGSQIATLENCFRHQAKMALLLWQLIISTTISVHKYIGFTWIHDV